MRFTRSLSLTLTVLWVSFAAVATETSPVPPWPGMLPAQRVAHVTGAPLLAAARAGNRVVAVGDHGVILLSEDGTSFRQAQAVPVRSMLTSVQFLNPRVGYAAGHDGVVLSTQDSGETWTLLRAAPGTEQPILSLHFDSMEHGIAVGLYGWAIETRDAGRTWNELRVGTGEDADRHLFHVFASNRGTLFIAGEAGTIFRSADRGKSWQALSTGNKGSLWSGRSLLDGTMLVCGMRGHLYRSSDDGQTWQAVESHTTQSLTGITQLVDGSVIVVGLAGTVLSSVDGGKRFTLSERAGREPLTAVLANASLPPVLVSMVGPLASVQPAAR
jgi:photosystem II stability/assembly factor-like uncharacterized protein